MAGNGKGGNGRSDTPRSIPPPDPGSSRVGARLARAVRLPEAWVEYRWTPAILFVLMGLCWGLLLGGGQRFAPQALEPGEIAPHNIRSPTTVVAEDPEATEQARLAAAERVLPVVDLQADLGDRLRRRITAAFEAMRAEHESAAAQRRAVEEALAIPLPDAVHARLMEQRDKLSFELKLKDLISGVDGLWIAEEPERWPVLYPRGVQIRSSLEAAEERTLAPENYGGIVNRTAAAEDIRQRIRSRYRDAGRAERDLLGTMVDLLVEVNLRPNPVETDARRAAAAEAVKPVLFQLKAGEVVVRAGERVTPAQHRRLTALAEQERLLDVWLARSAKIGLTILLIALLLPWVPQRRWRTLGHPQDLVFLLAVSTLLLIVIRIMRALSEPLFLAAPEMPREALLLAMPFAALGMLCRPFFRVQIAYAIAVLFAAVLAIFLEPVALVLPYALLGGAVGVERLRHSKRRGHFHLAGLQVGLVQAAVWVLYGLISPGVTASQLLYGVPVALFGGLLASMLASTLLPVGELLGRYVSEVRLLELSQDDQPLLRWLHLNAPGTFNHSLSVGRLAEAACERIGADALLARVGAYYHDIGKGLWPHYFVENQRHGNPHDKLKPQLSARVIIAHVAKGAELAERHNLPPALLDFIWQHHGTGRVEYFYRQALEAGGGKETEDDSMFRYPGPRPRTKETAVMMLADTVESALRTLEQPTPDRIHQFVTRLVEKIYSSQELDESPLSLRDLRATVDAFVEVLVGMYHQRIDYPHALKPVAARPERSERAESTDPDVRSA